MNLRGPLHNQLDPDFYVRFTVLKSKIRWFTSVPDSKLYLILLQLVSLICCHIKDL